MVQRRAILPSDMCRRPRASSSLSELTHVADLDDGR